MSLTRYNDAKVVGFALAAPDTPETVIAKPAGLSLVVGRVVVVVPPAVAGGYFKIMDGTTVIYEAGGLTGPASFVVVGGQPSEIDGALMAQVNDIRITISAWAQYGQL